MTDEANNPNDPYVTESRLQTILDESFKKLTKSICTDIGGLISDLADHIDKRFNKVEADIAELKKDMQEVKHRLAVHDSVDESQDEKLAKHERWHYQTAAKLQFKLK